MDSVSALPPRPLSVLIIGANGYLGSAISRAFLRAAGPTPLFFKVYGLVRRAHAAGSLAAQEVIPIVGSLSDTDTLCPTILSHSSTWDVIVGCTEPSKIDRAEEERHWNGILALVRRLAKSSVSNSTGKPVRPLVLWSSGCKDYGTTGLHGAPDLVPHTETSPLHPHELVRCRMEAGLNALEAARESDGAAGFDAAVVRATPLFGYSGSYYGAAFDYAAAFAAAVVGDKKVLKFTADPRTILHGVHVDDCADAYVALARTALFGAAGSDNASSDVSPQNGRAAVAGQVFNISGRRYETLDEVGAALASDYGFTGGPCFGVSPAELPREVDQGSALVFGYSQWVGSEKIRSVTGWSDKRPLFSENLPAYRLAYDAAREAGNDNILKIRRRIAGNWGDE